MAEAGLTSTGVPESDPYENQILVPKKYEVRFPYPAPELLATIIEPELLSEEMIAFMAASDKFLPHYHIPLQSGSDHVLSLMKRKYRRDVFAQRVSEIKKIVPHACIAADVIIGFPGETEDEFKSTYNFVDGLDISYMHVFTYSERPGTMAAKLDGRVSSQDKRERSRILHELSDKKKRKFYGSNIGSVRKVLFESDNSGGYMHGFTGNYLKVKTRYDESMVNKIVEVKLDSLDDDGVFLFKP